MQFFLQAVIGLLIAFAGYWILDQVLPPGRIRVVVEVLVVGLSLAVGWWLLNRLMVV